MSDQKQTINIPRTWKYAIVRNLIGYYGLFAVRGEVDEKGAFTPVSISGDIPIGGWFPTPNDVYEFLQHLYDKIMKDERFEKLDQLDAITLEPLSGETQLTVVKEKDDDSKST